MSTALDVAYHILFLAEREDRNMYPLKLIKIVYACQAWRLAYNKPPFFEEDIQAWKFGPVIKSLYDEFKKFGLNNFYVVGGAREKNILSEEEKEWIKKVWDTYKDYGFYTLRDMSNEEGTPWKQVYNGNFDTIIDKGRIAKFYQETYNINKTKED